MATLSAITPETLDETWTAARGAVADAPSHQDASARFVDAVYEGFQESLALARVFLTSPFSALPPSYEAFATNAAESGGGAGELNNGTLTLSLLATRGAEEAWNDVQRSKAHLAFPLISQAFVDSSPMTAWLLRQFELGSALFEGGLIVSSGKSSMRTFFLPDARSSRDEQDRLIVADQDFVENHGVKAVFGAGGPYWEGSRYVLACVFFTREELGREILDTLRPLFMRFKNATAVLIKQRKIFA